MKLTHYKNYLILLLMALNVSAFAETQQPYNRVSFTVSADAEVENDRLVARLFAEARGSNTPELARQVNEAINWGLEVAKKQAGVEVHTLNYSTNPEYDKDGKVSGWHVRQTMQLKSDNSQVLSQLLGELQERLSIESMQYQVSTKLRKATEETLIADALTEFTQRAEQIKKNMGRQSYKVVSLNVSNSFSERPPYPMMMERSMTVKASGMPAPGLTAGKQEIMVNVNGEIELSEN